MGKTGWMFAVAALVVAAPAIAEPGWSVPKLPGDDGKPFLVPPKTPYVDPSLAPVAAPAAPIVPSDMKAVAQIGRQWGTVTSVLRSVAHNKEVGGVPNSYHLTGQAIDIARRPGVRHADIAAALRKAGFRPIPRLEGRTGDALIMQFHPEAT